MQFGKLWLLGGQKFFFMCDCYWYKNANILLEATKQQIYSGMNKHKYELIKFIQESYLSKAVLKYYIENIVGQLKFWSWFEFTESLNYWSFSDWESTVLVR